MLDGALDIASVFPHLLRPNFEYFVLPLARGVPLVGSLNDGISRAEGYDDFTVIVSRLGWRAQGEEARPQRGGQYRRSVRSSYTLVVDGTTHEFELQVVPSSVIPRTYFNTLNSEDQIFWHDMLRDMVFSEWNQRDYPTRADALRESPLVATSEWETDDHAYDYINAWYPANIRVTIEQGYVTNVEALVVVNGVRVWQPCDCVFSWLARM